MPLNIPVNVGPTERTTSTLLGGGLLALSPSVARWARTPLALLGGALVLRGVTGRCGVYKSLGLSSSEGGHHLSSGPASMLTGTVKVQQTLTINAPVNELYDYWRKLDNLLNFADNLVSITDEGNGLSHWVAQVPGGSTLSWKAQITEDFENQRISWETTADSELTHNGSVTFMPAPAGRGCEVRVVLRYQAPAGKLGQNLARLTGEEPGQQLLHNLRRFKRLVETGELARRDPNVQATVL